MIIRVVIVIVIFIVVTRVLPRVDEEIRDPEPEDYYGKCLPRQMKVDSEPEVATELNLNNTSMVNLDFLLNLILRSLLIIFVNFLCCKKVFRDI